MCSPLKIIVMGVSGCGKSTVGAALADALHGRFFDGDDLHPAGNIVKMSAGIPLDDADRWPWLDAVGDRLDAGAGTTVIGCSALKRSYRDRIRSRVHKGIVCVHLAGPIDLIAARMRNRPGHFMPASLLESQFATLEPPDDGEVAATIGLDLALPEAVACSLAFLRHLQAGPEPCAGGGNPMECAGE